MKRNIFFNIACIMLVLTNIYANEAIKSMKNDIFVEDDNEVIYTINVLLQFGEVLLTSKIEQNDTGLSIRLKTHENKESEWFHLYINEELYYFGQFNYILPSVKRNFGVISSIELHVNKPDLAVLTMPYYICIHEKRSNSTTNDHCIGCTYIQPPVENRTGAYQEYSLRDATGQLI